MKEQVASADNVLLIADRLTGQDRREEYGQPLDNFSCTAVVWSALLKYAGFIPEDARCLTPEIVQLLMVALKLVRASQNPEHADSLIDIAGYVRTIQMTQQEREFRSAKAQQ